MEATTFPARHENLFYRERGDAYRLPPKARRIYNTEFEPYRAFMFDGILPPECLDRRYASTVESPETGSLELRYGDQMWEGDRLADGVVDMFFREGARSSRKMLVMALDHGIESVDNPPPELVRLFEQLDRIPDWIDEDTIAAGNTVALRGGLFSHTLFFLIDLILTHYTGMARPLAATGKINAEYRLIETATFFAEVNQPGSMLRFSEGFKRAVLVRVMHALVRRRLTDPDHPAFVSYDTAGMCISNHDMAGMCWAYSLQIALAFRRFGGEFSEADMRGLHRYWCYICYVMGVNEATIPKSFEENALFMNYHWASAEAPPPGTDALRDQMLQQFSVAGQQSRMLNLAGRYVLTPMFRRMFGDAACEGLRIPDSRLKHVIQPVLFVVVRGHFAAQRAMFRLRPAKRLGNTFFEHYDRKNVARLAQVHDGIAAIERRRSLGTYSHHDAADGDGQAGDHELRSGLALIYATAMNRTDPSR